MIIKLIMEKKYADEKTITNDKIKGVKFASLKKKRKASLKEINTQTKSNVFPCNPNC